MQHTVVGSTNGANVLVLGRVNTIYETFSITLLLIATAVIVLQTPDPTTIRRLEDILSPLFPQGHFLLYYFPIITKQSKQGFISAYNTNFKTISHYLKHDMFVILLRLLHLVKDPHVTLMEPVGSLIFWAKIYQRTHRFQISCPFLLL